jgi:hypothetical protein
MVTYPLSKIVSYTKTHMRDERGGYKLNIHYVLWERATLESADYIQKHLADVLVFAHKKKLWDYAIQLLSDSKADGTCMEFGVYKGQSINYFSRKLPNLSFYGFDSFEGLAEDWKGHQAKKGTFDLKGKLPEVNTNVELIKGWFDQTLPKFIKSTLKKGKVSFLHIDGDTYEAAAIVFDQMKAYIKPGTLILFDEYVGYPNWQKGEYLAWQEFAKAAKIKYRYKGFSVQQALIEIL